MLPIEIIDSITLWLKKKEESIIILGYKPVGGGSINEAYKVLTSSGNFFLKYNYSNRFPGMFEVEASGLATLKLTKTVNAPTPLTTESVGKYSYLLMEFEEHGKPITDYWEKLGKQLADLHKNTNAFFGLDYDNYIGSLTQNNSKSKNFIEFFIQRRLEPMVRQAVDNNFLLQKDTAHFDSLYKKLNELIPEESPSLIHGDLWSGNVIVSSLGQPCLIDPAIYYGNRESDIAMTKLFGGFSNQFYESYDYHFPLQKGWQSRIELHQLYTLLVHVNLFGTGYTSQLRRIIDKY